MVNNRFYFIDKVINDINCNFSIIIVNDASTQKKPENCFNFKNLKSIKIINMLENRGHGRCNAAGLKYIYENEDFDYVLPMDGDGEDRPEEIIQFVEKIKTDPEIPVVGERIKRSESNLFKFCYVVHKILTFIFTGKSIKFGHFSCIPKSIVKEMVNDAINTLSNKNLTDEEKKRMRIRVCSLFSPHTDSSTAATKRYLDY